MLPSNPSPPIWSYHWCTVHCSLRGTRSGARTEGRGWRRKCFWSVFRFLQPELRSYNINVLTTNTTKLTNFEIKIIKLVFHHQKVECLRKRATLHIFILHISKVEKIVSVRGIWPPLCITSGSWTISLQRNVQSHITLPHPPNPASNLSAVFPFFPRGVVGEKYSAHSQTPPYNPLTLCPHIPQLDTRIV